MASKAPAVQPSILPTSTDDYFAGLPSGMENVTAADLMIPRLTIVQALSPQLLKSRPEYNPEAAIGDFCDTGLNEIFKDAIEIIPCYFARVFLEWYPRSTNKGIAANHGMNAAILEKCKPDDKNRMILPNGNYVAETATYFVLNLTAGGRRSFIPLTSTQLKNSRKWMTLITNIKLNRADGTQFTPPIFYKSWIATTVEQSNNEGVWRGWNFAPGREILTIDPTKALLNEAIEFSTQAKEGLVKGDLTGDIEEHANTEPNANDTM
jgi:hypothetical protein